MSNSGGRVGAGAGLGLIALLLLGSGGCASLGYHIVKPTPIDQAPEEVPESQLLDVGVAISEAPELSEKKLQKQGTTEDIRTAESVYVPYHLKNTFQMSSHWGSVQVVPPEADTGDLTVTTELIESNGELMRIKVEAVDASGRVWLTRKYQAKVKGELYDGTVPSEHEAFQDLYNTIANDLSGFKRSLTPSEIEEIRTVSELRFAREFAPDAYTDYLAEARDGRLVVERLPADDDPLMARLDRVREREHMFVDTLNQHYEGFYTNMWEAYENWRRYNLAERVARREVEQEAFFRTVAGVLMILAAIGLEAGDVSGTESIGDILVLGGGAVIISGVNVSQQAQIHAAAIEELAESFGAEMRPTVMELEGKQYELTGTASEQYERLKELLREIYYEETGFASAGAGEGPGPEDPVPAEAQTAP